MKLVTIGLAGAALVAPVSAAQGCSGDLLGVYTTWIGSGDLFASDGLRLTSAGAILQQDRANMHRFRRPDRGDQGDSMFLSAQSRALIPRWLHHISPGTAAAIRRGNVRIMVRVYEGCIDVSRA